MSTLAIDYPLASFPGLPVKEGQSFHGFVHDGVVTVVVPAAASPDSAQGAENTAFVEKWRGAFSVPGQAQQDADPRLAYLVEKHLK